MPETPPLLDQSQLDAFSKYSGATIDQPSIQPTPFRGLSNPLPSLPGSESNLSELDQLTQKALNGKPSNGKLGPGGNPLTIGELQNQPYHLYDPALEGKDENMLAINQGFWSKAANGVIKMGGTALNTAVSSTFGAINGLAQWGASGKFSSFYDNDFTHALDDGMKKMEEMFPHYQTTRQRASDWYEPVNLFSANFVFDNVVKNLGFSLGAAAPALAIGKALNALRISSRLFALGEGLSAVEAVDGASQLPRLQQLASAEGKLKNIIGGGLKSLGAPQVNGVEQGGHLVQAIASALSSSGEASMEAYNNINEFRNNRIKEYTDKHGYAPTGVDLAEINTNAEGVGNSSYWMNAALLTGTEYVQLPKIFGSTFKGEKSLLNATLYDAETGLLKSALPTGIAGFARKARNFASLGFNEAEAFEEGAQYAIQTGTQDYYNKKYRKEGTDFLSSLGFGVKQALGTSEGLENIFLGGFSGALMTSGFISSKGIGQTGKIGERGVFGYGGERARNTEALIKGVNDAKFMDYLKKGVDQANRALTIQEQREQSIRQGDILESKDLEQDYAHNYLAHRIKYGRFDLVQDDINHTRELASTPEGFAILQQQGKAAETDTPQTFIKRLDNIQRNALFIKEQYEQLNTKYGGLQKDGKPIYTPEVIDKMVYAAAKIRDYDQRIPELNTSLATHGINSGLAIQEVLGTEGAVKGSIKEVEKQIDALQIPEKEDIHRDFQDILELTKRRKQFLDEYNEIKKTPEKFEEVKVKSPEANPTTGKVEPLEVKTKSGVKKLDIGEKYFLSNIETPTKQSFIKRGYPEFTVISQDEKGLTVKDHNGVVKVIPTSELEKFDIGKVSDIAKNPKAAFYFANRDKIFNYKFKKGVRPGVLRYSTKQDELIFEYKDDQGKTRTIPVTGKDFSYQIAKSKGYNEPIIVASDQRLQPKEEDIQKSITPQDVESRFTRRFNMLASLVTDTRENLNKTNKTLETKREELSKLEESYKNLEETANSKTEKGNLKKVAKTALKTMKVLEETRQGLLNDISSLESEKEELEVALPYFEEIYENSDQLPENLRDALPQLKDEIGQLNELIDTTETAIQDNKSLIKRIEQLLHSSYKLFKHYISVLKGNLPYTNLDEYQDKIEKYLGEEGAKQLIESGEGFVSAINALSSDISDLETGLEINLNEEKLKELRTNLKELKEGLKDLQNKRTAREALFDYFEGKIQEFDRLEKARKALASDQEIQKKFFSSVKGLEGDIATVDSDEPATNVSYMKDLSIIARTGTSEKYEDSAPNSVARREHTFLLNLSKGKFAGRTFKTILVTKNTEEALGLKGIIDPAFPEAIRIVYIEVHPDNTYNFIDSEGNNVTKEEDISKMAYGTMHDENLQYKGKPAYTNKGNLDEKAIKEQYKKTRQDIMSITPENLDNIQDYFINFQVSRGIPNTTSGAQNNLLDTGIISEEDLFTPLIKVPTYGKTEFGSEGDKINMPLGKVVFNYLGNLFFLNNRNLSDSEARNISAILVHAIKGLTSTGEVSLQLQKYLRGVTYFKTPKENQKPTRNQIWFSEDGKRLFIGDKGANFDVFTLNPEDLVSVLKGTYTYVDNRHLLEFAKNPKNTPFEELSIKGDQVVVTKTWPSYQHYLLEKRQDGLAPLTTNITTNSNELPLKQKYPILDIQALKNQSIVPNTTITKKETKEKKESPRKIVYDGTTVNTAFTSKNEPIKFTTDGKTVTIVENDFNDLVTARLQSEGKTEEDIKRLIISVANNAILNDKEVAAISKTIDQQIQDVVNTPENYNNWSNIRDGSDKQQFLDQINLGLSPFEKVADKSKITEDAIRESLKNNKAFANKDVVDKLVPLILEKYKETKPLTTTNSVEVKPIVYDNTTVNTAFSSKGEPIHFTVDENGAVTILAHADNTAVIKRLKDLGKTPEEARKLVGAVADNAVINDRADVVQTKEEVEKKEEVVEQQEVDSEESPFFEEDPFENLPPADKAATRLNLKPFLIQGNTAQEEMDVRSMLPNVKIETLTNIADVTGGGKAWGYALPHFIAVWEEAPYGVRYHEAFEQVFNFILKSKDRKALYNEFKQREGSFITFEGKTRKYNEATFKEAKEELADEFAEYRSEGKLIKPTPIKKSFFERLLSFLKQLFGKPLSVEKAFYTLANKGYSNSIISAPIDVEKQYKRTVVNTPESLVQDAIIGMTAELFISKWEKDASLIEQLEENEKEATDTLFSQLKTGLTEYFEEATSKGLRAIIAEEMSINPSRKQELRDLYFKVLDNWKNIQNQWGNYMEDLKHFLKTFDVAFSVDDDGNIQFNDDVTDVPEERSQSDYNSDDRLFISSKNSASKAVKLLFATVADSKFVEEVTKNAIGNIVSKYQGNQINIDNNQMLMKSLASYARLFNYTLDNAANINGIENIIAKLRSVSSNHHIRTNANLQVLLNRVGFDKVSYDSETNKDIHTPIGWKELDKAQRKMLLKLENTLSKQKPSFFIQQSESKRSHRILPTNISDRTNQLKDEWVENMKGSSYSYGKESTISFNKNVLSNNNFKFLENLGIPFTEKDYNTLPQKPKNEFNKVLPKIYEDINYYTAHPLPVNAKIKDLPFNGRLTTLAQIYSEYVEGNSAESQHPNADGKATGNKILPNYASYILADLNTVKNKKEFLALNPQFEDLYMGSSDLLNQFFDKEGNRTNFDVSVAISEGRRSYIEGISTTSMTYGERLIYEINNNLYGIYYTLVPADSSTQWGLKLTNPITRAYLESSKEASLEIYARKMWESLQNEVELAQDYNNRKSIISLNTKVDKRPIGKSLRFFKEILSPEFVGTINKIIDKNTELSEEQYTRFKKELLDYVEDRAKDTISALDEYKLINRSSKDLEIGGIDNNFISKLGKINEEKLKDIMFLREANYIFQNIEMHKFLFNDPAQYKDAEKRIKSFLSGREYSNQSQELNEIHNQELNKSGDYVLTPDDFGYKHHSNSIQIQTISKLTHHSINTQIKEAIGKRGDKFDDTDTGDSQSLVDPGTYREIMYKSGGRFTVKQDKAHEWLMAYQRSQMLKKGQFDNAKKDYSKELRKADEKILQEDLNDAVLNILKPIISGVKYEDGIAKQYLIKTSTAPLYYYFVEGTPAEQILLNMQKGGVGMLVMDSAHKVGMEEGKVLPLYGEDGKISKFTTPTTIDYKYFGIQVETGGVKDYQTQGSQLTKLILQNLLNMGVPIDFNGTKSEWEQLGEEAKLKYPIYALVQKHNEILSTMVVKRSEKLFQKLGITKGEFGYEYKDKKLVADFILSELTRREMPTNMGVGIETNAEGEFTTPLESNPNYRKIKEILWSTLEKNITRPKVSGGAKILLSAIGYENYTPVTINGKTVYTSSKLKFYEKTEDGKKVNACQIAIPYLFGLNTLRQIEKSQKIKFATQKEGFEHVRKYLLNTQEGRSLLEGIGFRIPTQGLNSVDFFEIAEFLPPQMGEAIIFPSEIVTKAGSDFDVDKMSTYTKNFYLDANGYPKPVKYIKDRTARIQFYTDEFMSKIETLADRASLSKKRNFNLFNTLKSIDEGTMKPKAEQKWMNIFDEMFPRMGFEEISSILLEAAIAADKRYDELTDWDVQEILLDKFLEDKEIEGLENNYYDTIKEIASLPENFGRLVTPNNADQLKKISDNIVDLKHKKGFSPTNYSRLVNSSYMSLKRHLFLIMKKAVGVAAVGNTNLALNQQADFSMKIPQYLISTPAESPNFAVRFDYNDLKDGLLHLSGIKNGLEDFLSDLHSQVIDGAVDVSKDEWLANLVGDAKALPVLLYMFKLGISPKTTAYYINQPAIQEYLRLRGVHASISKLTTWVNEKWPSDIEKDIQTKVLDLKTYMSKSQRAIMYETKPNRYTDKDMESTIPKEYSSMTKDEKMLQVQMLHDYRGWEKLSSDFFTSTNASNYDTTQFTSPEVVDNKALAFQKALKTESLSGNISETQKVLATSFIGTIKREIENTSDALASLLNTQKGNAKEALNKMLLKLYIQFFSMEDKIKYQQRAEASLIDFVSQNSSEYGKFKFAGLIKVLFFKEGGIADFVEAAQKHRLLKDNKIIQNIQVVKDPRPNYPSYIRLKEQDYDTYTSNLWTASLKELMDGNVMIKVKGKERTSKSLMDYILLSQVMQYGINRAKGSFLHLIPTERYSELLAPALKSMEGTEEWYDKDMFYRNNWRDSKLVPEAYYYEGQEIEGEWKNFTPTYTISELPNAKLIGQPLNKKHLPFIKVTERPNKEDKTDIRVSLYKRVDAGENTPITVKSWVVGQFGRGYQVSKVLYVKVNKLGNENLKEYIDRSYLEENKPIPETTSEEVIDALEAKGTTITPIELTDLVSTDEFMQELVEQEYERGEGFEEFKDKLNRKDC